MSTAANATRILLPETFRSVWIKLTEATESTTTNARTALQSLERNSTSAAAIGTVLIKAPRSRISRISTAVNATVDVP